MSGHKLGSDPKFVDFFEQSGETWWKGFLSSCSWPNHSLKSEEGCLASFADGGAVSGVSTEQFRLDVTLVLTAHLRQFQLTMHLHIATYGR